MQLKNLISVLKSGNLALGSKLSNLLTEDCTIVEFTNESVIFTKDGMLVHATFKNPLCENMTADHLVDNEVISIPINSLNKELKSSLKAVVEGVLTEDFVSAEENLARFCETYYQTSVLKNKCPELFTEAVVKNTARFKVRKKAHEAIGKFKSEVFNIAVVEEELESNFSALTSVVEESGIVLALGRNKVEEIVTESLLGNSELSKSITKHLYTIVEKLNDVNDDLSALEDEDYDLDMGQYPDEDPSEVGSEDYSMDEPPTDINFDEEDAESTPGEFEPFDPATLSEEEIKELHKTVLKSILNSIKEFVIEKANSLDELDVDPDLEESIVQDIEALEDPEITDARLSEIEAKWQPMIGYFLDSDYHDSELTDEEFTNDIDSTIPNAGFSEEIGDLDTEAPPATEGMDEPSMDQEQNEEPPMPNGSR